MFGTAWMNCGRTRFAVLPLVAFVLGLAVMSTPVAHAASRPSSYIPDYSPCQLTIWETLHEDTFTHSANNIGYTIYDDLQETYDDHFGVWCQHYQDHLYLTANSSNPGGTATAKVAPCGGSYSSSSYSFGSGAFTKKDIGVSPTIVVSSPGAAQDGDALSAAGQNWSDNGTCGGH